MWKTDPACYIRQTYFLRAHLVSGVPRPADGVEHAWLTKEELAERLGGATSSKGDVDYYSHISDLLSR